MTPEMYEAIKVLWNRESHAEQRQLIFRFLQANGCNKRGSWMEFLRDHFKLSANSQTNISPLEPARLKLLTWGNIEEQ